MKLVEMKCKNCGAELVFANGVYSCSFCHSSFLQAELITPNKANVEFVVKGGVLSSYKGNNRVVNIPDGVIAIGPGAFKDNLTIIPGIT